MALRLTVKSCPYAYSRQLRTHRLAVEIKAEMWHSERILKWRSNHDATLYLADSLYTEGCRKSEGLPQAARRNEEGIRSSRRQAEGNLLDVGSVRRGCHRRVPGRCDGLTSQPGWSHAGLRPE